MPLDKVMGVDEEAYRRNWKKDPDAYRKWNKPMGERYENDTVNPPPFPLAPPNNLPTCVSCKFFLPSAEPGYGRCRRWPPSRLTHTWTFFGLRRLSDYIEVNADLEACGEYKRVPVSSDSDATYQVE